MAVTFVCLSRSQSSLNDALSIYTKRKHEASLDKNHSRNVRPVRTRRRRNRCNGYKPPPIQYENSDATTKWYHAKNAEACMSVQSSVLARTEKKPCPGAECEKMGN
ncbi:hypothetical protein SNOG_12189 [Parastagonospora nodorum SN15]|uniref:Uncharacterized protein n=1 Tax=Phaeosphaeria nodorum (strain SN15 / ATCC MYA-4574 / FGSC 10173) TaxID=321614 RepID=Q0U7S5_PHANO|nr:hypothetical protein SNOG_12189 [Parastagonospora nodorum SN15]EAT80601.1 hypothetical protein SNOG_12189 [Parastagonospora nodorum SN15]